MRKRLIELNTIINFINTDENLVSLIDLYLWVSQSDLISTFSRYYNLINDIRKEHNNYLIARRGTNEK